MRGVIHDQAPPPTQAANGAENREQSLEDILFFGSYTWGNWIKEKWSRKGQAVGERDRVNIEKWMLDMGLLRISIIGHTMSARINGWQEMMGKKVGEWEEKWEMVMEKFQGRREELEKRLKWEERQTVKIWMREPEGREDAQKKWSRVMSQALLEEEEWTEWNRVTKWRGWQTLKKRRRKKVREAWGAQDAMGLMICESMNLMMEGEWQMWVAERVRTWVARGITVGIILRLQDVLEGLVGDNRVKVLKVLGILVNEQQRWRMKLQRGEPAVQADWSNQPGDDKLMELMVDVEGVHSAEESWQIIPEDRESVDSRAHHMLDSVWQGLTKGPSSSKGPGRSKVGRLRALRKIRV